MEKNAEKQNTKRRSTFAVLFYINRTKMRKDGMCQLLCKVSIDAEWAQIGTKVSVNPTIWNPEKGRADGRSENAVTVNRAIDDLTSEIAGHYDRIKNSLGFITAELVKNAVKGIGQKPLTLLALLREHNEEFKKRVGIDRIQETYDSYLRSYKHLSAFIREKKGVEDVTLRSLDRVFYDDFEIFLRTDRNLKPKSVHEHLYRLKKLTMCAVSQGTLRRGYRRQAQEQYAQMGDLLAAAAHAPAEEPTGPVGYRVSSALRPKEGQQLCGDQLATVETGGMLYLLLSDGMGSGPEAHREAALTVRLLEQFLRAGIEAAPALKTLNSALALRGETGGAFTTIDLLALRRSTGEATLYKYGAAPSYLKHTAHVTRFTAHSLPAGLQATTEPPEVTRLALPAGSYFVMISDGIADENSDEWLQNLLVGWNGTDVHALTALILSESRSRRGLEDDCAVLAVHLPLPGENHPRQV